MDLDLTDSPQPFFVPTRTQSFIKATDGKHLNVWLCLGEYRANELFQQEISKLDPFVNWLGEETAVRAWDGYMASAQVEEDE